MQLQCHCKNVQIELSDTPDSLTQCNCSLCHRYAALWGHFEAEKVDVSVRLKNTVEYIQGDRCIAFHFCPTCGCLTHYLTTDKVAEAKVVINFRMIEPAEIAGIKIRHFDGADSWSYR